MHSLYIFIKRDLKGTAPLILDEIIGRSSPHHGIDKFSFNIYFAFIKLNVSTGNRGPFARSENEPGINLYSIF